LSHRDQVVLIPGAGEALALLQKAGYLLIVVSNQSGVARGLIKKSELGPIHEKMNKLLAPCGAKIDEFSICTHHPDEDCACRKPKPKLLVDAAKKHGIDLSHSYMVGDRPSDLAAGRAAGCRGVALVRTGEGAEHEASLKKGEADFVGDSLMRIADWILSQEA
jgi:histidinol-phosphate phosphatase family protein